MEKVRYHEMLPHEIVARRKRFPAAFIGAGGLEWHGEHQAVGLDALKAEALCELAARRSGGFAFPTLWYGEPRAYALMEATVDDDGRIKRKMGFRKRCFTDAYWGRGGEEQVAFYQSLVMHVLMQMRSLEMKAVCMLTGHYPLRVFAEPVVERFNAEFGPQGTLAHVAIEPHYAGDERLAGGDHAAMWETSYLSYLRPDCVDLTVYRGRESEDLIGVRGRDPRTEASVKRGRRGCEAIVEGMIAKAKELLAAAGKKNG